MRDTDRLLIAEMLRVPCNPNPPISNLDILMLRYFGEARQRIAEEYSELFHATGLEPIPVLPTAGAFSVVEARPV